MMTQQMSAKGFARRLRKAMRAIDDRRFPLRGVFHLRDEAERIIAPEHVARDYARSRVVKELAPPWEVFVVEQPDQLTWAKVEDGYSAEFPNEMAYYLIRRVNSRKFVLSIEFDSSRGAESENIAEGTLRDCKAFAQQRVSEEFVRTN